MSLLHHVRELCWRVGVDIRRFPESLPAHRQVQQLTYNRVSVLLDVGASRGQYAADLRRLGYLGQIVSFEPLPVSFDSLERRAKRDPLWRALPVALGPEEATVTLNIAGNGGDSSSLLTMLDRHRAAAPQAITTGSTQVSQTTLDALWPALDLDGQRVFLKLDVQGYERDVVEGARDSVSRCIGIQLEVSLVPLYDGGMLYAEAFDLARLLGFHLSCVTPGFTDNATGQTLQMDCMFFR